MNGVARGFRSRACNTTPAAASVEPTRAAASARQPRDKENLCVHVVGKPPDRSNTLAKSMRVVPTSGAPITARNASVPNASVHSTRRRRTSGMGRLSKRYHRQVSGGLMEVHLGGHAVERPDAICRQRVLGGTSRLHVTVADQNERPAQAGGEV